MPRTVLTAIPFSRISPAAPSRAASALPARVVGVLRAPHSTFAALAQAPRWADVLALTCVVTCAAAAALLATDVGRLALLDQMERTAVAFGQPVDDAAYAGFLRASENGTGYAALLALATGPLLVFGVSLLLYFVFTNRGGGSASYRQLLAITAHAGVILALRQVLVAPLNYARETLASPLTLSLFFTTLDEASVLARFLGALDLFVLWWASALAIGVAVLYERRARPLVMAFGGAYLALAALLALAMALAGAMA